jgi:hypothetical protein
VPTAGGKEVVFFVAGQMVKPHARPRQSHVSTGEAADKHGRIAAHATSNINQFRHLAALSLLRTNFFRWRLCAALIAV